MNFENIFKRSGKDTYQLRNKANFNNEFIGKVKNFLSKTGDNDLEEIEKESLSISENLGKDIEPKIIRLYERAINSFKEKGFEDVTLLPVYLLDSSSLKDLGVTKSTHIEMKNLFMKGSNGVEHTTTKQITFIKVLGHELYHSTCKRSLDVFLKKESGSNTVSFKTGGSGASYPVNQEGDASMALEEGLAVLFEKKMFELSKSEFKEFQIKEYEEWLKSYLSHPKSVNLLQGLPFSEDMIDVAHKGEIKDDQVKVSFSLNQYMSKKLTEYLIKEIPDFEKLVEDARLNRHTLGLSRAIEKRFGEGSYRRITTAQTSEAAQLLKELGGDIPGIDDYIEKNKINREPKPLEQLRESAKDLMQNNIFGFMQTHKIGVLLNAMGVKKVSEFSLAFNKPMTPFLQRKIETEEEKVRKTLENLGLHVNSYVIDNGPILMLQFDTSLNKSNLDQLNQIRNTEQSKVIRIDQIKMDHIKQGELFGFPKTAIEGFINGDSLGFKNLPDEVKNSRLGKFMERFHYFGLSKKHWKDELKVLEKWMKSIDDLLPGYLDNVPEDDFKNE